MTALAAIRTESTIVMASDSAATAGLQLLVRFDPKIFRSGPFLIGGTASYRALQLLRFDNALAQMEPTENEATEFMVRSFVPRLRTILKEGGHIHVENGCERSEAILLAAFRSHLFRIDTDFQVAESADSFIACGCGEEIMLGSLFSTSGDPRQRLEIALSAAERYSAGVRRPWLFMTT